MTTVPLALPGKEAGLGTWAWLQLGRVYDHLGDTKKAREAFRNVLERPDYREAHAQARLALDEEAGSVGD